MLFRFSRLFRELPRASLFVCLVGSASLATTLGCRTVAEQSALGHSSSSPVSRSPSDPLSRWIELGSRGSDIRGLLQIIATGAFGNRLEVDPEVSGSFKGETGRTTIAEALDLICREAECSWRVEGDPPILIVKAANH